MIEAHDIAISSQPSDITKPPIQEESGEAKRARIEAIRAKMQEELQADIYQVRDENPLMTTDEMATTGADI